MLLPVAFVTLCCQYNAPPLHVLKECKKSEEKLAALGKFRRLVAEAQQAYFVSMAKILHNWTYRDVTNFLGEHGFSFDLDLEHSQSWVKLRRNGEPDTFVEIKFTQGFYSPKAMQKMVHLSGISEDEWNKCANS